MQVFPLVDPEEQALYWLGHFCWRQAPSPLHEFAVLHCESACKAATAVLEAEDRHEFLQAVSLQAPIQLMRSTQV